jgi:hypothetical protein
LLSAAAASAEGRRTESVTTAHSPGISRPMDARTLTAAVWRDGDDGGGGGGDDDDNDDDDEDADTVGDAAPVSETLVSVSAAAAAAVAAAPAAVSGCGCSEEDSAGVAASAIASPTKPSEST